VLPHPGISTQMTATASAAVSWRMCSSPAERRLTFVAARYPHNAAHEEMVQERHRRLRELTGVS
jgi:hypothetical protein